MKNSIKKESRTLLLSCTVLAGIMTLWCIYSIIQGALSFIANPINGNVFESDELFWVLFIFGFPLSFILFNMTSYSVFNISSRGVEEDAMSGCLYTIIINIFIMPLFTTALIYYALWLLLEIALFLIPYIGALLLAGGVYLFYLACNRLAASNKMKLFYACLISGVILYGTAGYFLNEMAAPSPSSKAPNSETPKQQTFEKSSLVGTWKLISQKKAGVSQPVKNYTLTFEKNDNCDNCGLFETFNGVKDRTTYTLLNKSIIMRLSLTDDTHDNEYRIVQIDKKRLVLTFVYLPDETTAGELIFEKK